ncbi:MAG: hypothetical protein ABIM85_05955 [candidate division WOR-3 bacterium]
MLKTIKKIKKYQPVEIIWQDAHFTTGWMREEEIDWKYQDEALIHRTIGYFLKETRYLVGVAQSIRSNYEMVGEVMKIPKKCILEIKVIKYAKNN